MTILYTNNDKFYLISSYGTYYNIVIEFGKTNNKIISNDILSTYEDLPFTKDNIYDMINRLIPITYDTIRDIGNNQYRLAFNDLIIVNDWLDIHNYIIKYNYN
jgi:hypothetical protein